MLPRLKGAGRGAGGGTTKNRIREHWHAVSDSPRNLLSTFFAKASTRLNPCQGPLENGNRLDLSERALTVFRAYLQSLTLFMVTPNSHFVKTQTPDADSRRGWLITKAPRGVSALSMWGRHREPTFPPVRVSHDVIAGKRSPWLQPPSSSACDWPRRSNRTTTRRCTGIDHPRSADDRFEAVRRET